MPDTHRIKRYDDYEDGDVTAMLNDLAVLIERLDRRLEKLEECIQTQELKIGRLIGLSREYQFVYQDESTPEDDPVPDTKPNEDHP